MFYLFVTALVVLYLYRQFVAFQKMQNTPAVTSEHVTEITSLEQFNQFIEKNPKVAVDFTATWCGPCRMIGPVFHKLAETTDGVAFASVDVDKVSDVAQKYRVRAMPTFVFIKNGAKVDELTGANKGGLESKLRSLAA
ncbi:hypothetical protein FBU59_004843 [Linderina macrospora]|uniref:Uncharacterized protein n=1 Tax=Linderina macrospora TaxID=4868 RepID=A0ACC1J4K2_9FUNG|nr:hypothetical protein FBU59_004843 [Linderina macrospora]